MMNDDEIIERATRAYYRRDPNADQPCGARSEVRRDIFGNREVVLANVNGELARYHYYPISDRIRRVKPEEVK